MSTTTYTPPSKYFKTDLGGSSKMLTSWKKEEGEASLEKVYDHVIHQANGAIDWYLKAKNVKRFFARNIRVAVIVGGAVAAALPLIAELLNVPIKAGYSAVLLGAVGALLVLDRAIGFSSGWVRFTLTQLKLRQVLYEFQMDWESERAALQGEQPGPEKVAQMLARCKAFIMQINTIVREETEVWIQEFQETLKMLDEKAKAQSVSSAAGALKLTVTNGDQSKIKNNGQSAEGWQMTLDNLPPKPYKGRHAGINNVLPGSHVIRVEGEIEGKKVQSETVVMIPAGGICDETLDLV